MALRGYKERLTLSERLRALTATPARSSATLWPGSVTARDRKLTSVSFWARGSFLPTLCLARLKSMPTPALRLRFMLLFGMTPAWNCAASDDQLALGERA